MGKLGSEAFMQLEALMGLLIARADSTHGCDTPLTQLGKDGEVVESTE